jgi:hypothetical protein
MLFTHSPTFSPTSGYYSINNLPWYIGDNCSVAKTYTISSGQPSWCGWQGVYCNPDNYAVDYLMYSSDAQGSISPSIGKLDTLKGILINSTRLHGTIPTQLGQLTQLYELGVMYTSITGTIPSSIGSVPSLQLLLLQHNALTGRVPSSFSKLIEWIDRGYVSVDGNFLSGTLPGAIGTIRSNPNLGKYLLKKLQCHSYANSSWFCFLSLFPMSHSTIA